MQYEQLDWNQKVNHLNILNKPPKNEEQAKIIISALNAEYSTVTLAALRYASRVKLNEYRKDYLKNCIQSL